MKIESNLLRFTASLRAVHAATKRDEADIVTRSARNVAFKAAQLTPVTTAAKIRGELREDGLLAKLAARNLKKTKGRYTRPEQAQEMRRIQAKRVNGARALRVGWADSITDLGGSFRGGRPRSGGSAAKGFGRKATIFNLTAHIRNAVVTENAFGHRTGAGDIPQLNSALIRAIGLVAAENEQYANRKLTQTLRRHSA